MRFGRLGDGGSVVLEERDEPAPGDHEVTVRLAACGVCGTDLEKLKGRYQTAQGRLGHEPVGVVEKVGADISSLRVGDRVFVHHHVPCYACAVCARGDRTFCPTYATTNIDPGGFSDVFRVPVTNVVRGAVLPLDPKISWEAGALLEPASCAYTALRRAGVPKGASVLVLGLGPVGLLSARLARAMGASWVGGTELSPLRSSAAEQGGADAVLDPRDPDGLRAAVDQATGGRGVDLAVVATGHPSVVKSGCELVRRGGTVSLVGLPDPGSRLEVDLQRLYLQGTRLVPSYATTEPDVREVHRMARDGRLTLADLVSHRVPLERIEEAFRLAASPLDAVKVVVTGPSF